MRSVGVRYLTPAQCSGGKCLEFAISNFGRRSHPNYPAGFEIYIDTNDDGIDDWVIFNSESGGFGASGPEPCLPGPGEHIVLGSLGLLHRCRPELRHLIFTVLLNTDGLPASLPSLKVPTSTTLGISLYAWDNYFTGAYTDSVVGMKFTPATPKFRVTSGTPSARSPRARC